MGNALLNLFLKFRITNNHDILYRCENMIQKIKKEEIDVLKNVLDQMGSLSLHI